MGFIVSVFAGMTLQKYSLRKSLTTSSVIKIIASLATTLQGIHSRGVVHHDVYQLNVCIRESPGGLQTTLIDFGYASKIKETEVVTSSNIVTYGPSSIGDVEALASLCRILFEENSLTLPMEIKVWLQNVRSLNLAEIMDLGELVKILEKLQ
ncbi:hypothetical protein OTU49_002838, partial [Cherax quadricarinatus]